MSAQSESQAPAIKCPRVRLLAQMAQDGLVEGFEVCADVFGTTSIILPAPEGGFVSASIASGNPSGCIHAADVGRVLVIIEGTPNCGSWLTVEVDERAIGKVALFYHSGERWIDLGSSGYWHLGWSTIEEGHITMGVVGKEMRGAKDALGLWSGTFVMTVSLHDKDGRKVSVGTRQFATAPFMLCSAIDPVEEVLVVDNQRNTAFVNSLRTVLAQAGAELRTLRPSEASRDVWIQDAVEIGRVCVPTSSGIVQAVSILPGIRAEHSEGLNCKPLDDAVRNHFRERNAVIPPPALPRSGTRWIDWFGNLEVSPPVTDRQGREFPFGRILTGVQHDCSMHPDILAFLDAQRVQTPALSVDTSWLQIGHVDEVVNFIPSSTSPGFRVLFPSTELATSILENLDRRGYGGATVFPGRRDQEVTVACLLEETARSAENRLVQDVLARIKSVLRAGLGVEESAFVELPALFKQGTAVIPNFVNSLHVNGHILVPDPSGPRLDGEDIVAVWLSSILSNLGLTVHFIDDWDAYHMNSGEIHCGTNAVRRLLHADWWRVPV